MPTKTVQIETKMGDGFTIESQVGKHLMKIDQPEAAGGKDEGPNPLQYFLLSLAGCISAISRIAANQKKIPLRGISLKIEGEMNTDGLLGKNTDARVGFSSINVIADIDADMTDEEKKEFIELVDSRCPV
ncbi:osmotically inducible protein C, partial [bacterium B17]